MPKEGRIRQKLGRSYLASVKVTANKSIISLDDVWKVVFHSIAKNVTLNICSFNHNLNMENNYVAFESIIQILLIHLFYENVICENPK